MSIFWNSEPLTKGYFADRSFSPYRSTLALERFLLANDFFEEDLIADISCGTGSELAYLSTRYPSKTFFGFDINSRFIKTANSRYSHLTNLKFFTENLFNVRNNKVFNKCSAVWFSQTLFWLDWWEDAIEAICTKNINKIGVSTLAWPMQMESEVIHYLEGRSKAPKNYVKYNVLSIQSWIDKFESFGFTRSSYSKFQIDIDLPIEDLSKLGSYTQTMPNGERLIFSAWQSMPIYNFFFGREN